jgi:hypothetical protein
MKRTEPSVSILKKKDYVPSWKRIPQTVVVPYLSGHRGLVGAYRDQFSSNTKEADK